MSLPLQQFTNHINKPKTYLLIGNVLLILILIILNNIKILPLRFGDFTFVTLIALAFALYRPGWAFLLFIGTIPLENINLAPAELGLAVRPFQLFGALSLLAIFIRFISGRLNFPLVKLKWFDYLIIAITLSGFLSILNAPDKITSFKLSIILATFAALYILVRNYIQTLEDVKRILPFFLSSATIVVIYGIWQNIRFMNKLEAFEAMPGRPNATFTEPDWLGIYIILVVSIIYCLIYYFLYKNSHDKDSQIFNFQFSIFNKLPITNYQLLIPKIILFALLIPSYILLILTVSRSAWLGAMAVTFFYLFIILTELKYRDWKWKGFSKQLAIIFSAGIISIASVYIFNLTSFQLFNRAQSTATGLQKITIACRPESDSGYPESDSVIDIPELEKYGCRHINLEEIEGETAKGNFVTEVSRKDPNVSRRGEIYQKSWAEIKNHPFLGIGWGSINNILGEDERGSSLNSSNIFLEVWLGSGIIGWISFFTLLIYILLKNIKNYFLTSNQEFKIFSLFMIIGWFAIIVPNLFNAGILLGFLWVYLGLVGVSEE